MTQKILKKHCNYMLRSI
uniref:Uncharacterized protein n=1 Tax=Arundo donax TaxID=35708 RepID=A0A0A9FB70_ARUDO